MSNTLKDANGKLLMTFIVPGVTLFCFVILVPIGVAVYYSLFDWQNIIKPVWNDFGNYKELVRDGLFFKALGNNLELAFYTVTGQIGIGYLTAFVLMSRGVRFRSFYRTVLYFPVMISSVVLSFLWMLVYDNQFGMLNTVLRAAGLSEFARPWLSRPETIIRALAAPLIWQWFAYYMVIFLGAFSAISNEVLESAELDGATGLKKVIFILVPMTYDTLKITVIICLASIMKTFDHVLVMTGGGPGTSSQVMALYAYNTTFSGLRIGYGTTIAVGIMAISLAITYTARKLMGGKRYE